MLRGDQAACDGHVGSSDKLRCRDRLWPKNDFRTLCQSFQQDLKLFYSPLPLLQSIRKTNLFLCCLRNKNIKPWRNLGSVLQYLIKYSFPPALLRYNCHVTYISLIDKRFLSYNNKYNFYGPVFSVLGGLWIVFETR